MDKFIAWLRSLKFPFARSTRRAGKLPVRGLIFWAAAFVVMIGLFVFMRQFTACWQLTALPGMRPASCPGAPTEYQGTTTPEVNAQGTAILPPPTPEDVAVPEVEYPTWDGGSRINIVFFGLRGGETSGEDCPLCTDTIIVFTIDPVSKTAGMISIPRDMYVNIPGFGYSRINTAWTSGEGAKLPGGGPGLAMKTASNFLGVPIQYYVQVNFDTFVSFVNMIGGIDIYNDETLILDPTGSGLDHFRLTCCGIRHLDGKLALAYSRTRHTKDGDVDRSRRQQKVILAIRDKVLSPSEFPTLMAKAPQLYSMFSAGIHTNIPLQDAIKLASLAKDVPFQSIKQGVIDDHMVNFGNVTLGGQNASILMPIPDKIRELRDQIFTTGGAASPMAQGDPRALMQADGARVCLANNSVTPSLDARTGNFLQAQGMNVALCGSPANTSQTLVIIYSPKLYTLRYLMNPLGMITTGNQIVFRPDASKGIDLEIHLGNDWAGKLPAGY
jgi:polyisoprenyl-teichoic acid--peptidoglycan teichoic acid transferase